MQIALFSYFDLGVSYGLSDDHFDEGALKAAETGLIGLEPAIGRGVIADLTATHPKILDLWRSEASNLVERESMELDPTEPRAEFVTALKKLIQTHGITRCELRIFAIGTVLVDLRFASGVPEHLVQGLRRCFEYAGYRPAIADRLHAAAVERVCEALTDPSEMSSPLTALTTRDLPDITTDTEEKDVEGNGYQERMLLPAFTTVLIGTEPGDEDAIDAMLKRLDRFEMRSKIDYEYHGRIVCGWATNAVLARKLIWPENPGKDEPGDQVGRMLMDIQIAHVFLGTCEAFEALFLGEVDHQVEGYLRARGGGRRPEALNRLRNLALAVVSLTDFDLVTETEEDRAYFDKFSEFSRIEGKRKFIERAAEMVYNVSDAEFQAGNQRREKLLNGILLLLTTVTLLSVSTDAYDFIRGSSTLISHRADREYVLIEVVLVLALLGALGAYFLTAAHPVKRLRRHQRDDEDLRPSWHELTDPTRRTAR